MDTEDNSEGMLERLRNSPRTVSAVIVILIIAGAIFAFSGRDEEPRAVANDAEENTTAVESETNDEDATDEEAVEAEGEADNEEAEEDEVPEAVVELPEAEETADAFVEVAHPGEGTTHLARRAAAAFIEANPPDFEITNEHRVFIEDYIVKKANNRTLAVGEQITISKELVQEAISESRELTDAQLQNLERFSQRIDWS